MKFSDRLKSARFIMAVVVTTLACVLVVWIVKKSGPETIDKIAPIAITGFFTVFSSIVTFYFTRTDRKKEQP